MKTQGPWLLGLVVAVAAVGCGAEADHDGDIVGTYEVTYHSMPAGGDCVTEGPDMVNPPNGFTPPPYSPYFRFANGSYSGYSLYDCSTAATETCSEWTFAGPIPRPMSLHLEREGLWTQESWGAGYTYATGNCSMRRDVASATLAGAGLRVEIRSYVLDVTGLANTECTYQLTQARVAELECGAFEVLVGTKVP